MTKSPYLSPSIERLITALCTLPGIGPRSAQRMAFYVLQRAQQQALTLAHALQQAIAVIKHCEICRTLTETSPCLLCSNPKRQSHLLCIVEMPADLIAIEQLGHYHGQYFVLMGRLSPMDGIGPEDIGMTQLTHRLAQGVIQEVIMATNPTVEGNTTAHYIASLCHQHHIRCSRIAHGVPLGGELEYLDSATLAEALNQRILLKKIN